MKQGDLLKCWRVIDAWKFISEKDNCVLTTHAGELKINDFVIFLKYRKMYCTDVFVISKFGIVLTNIWSFRKNEESK